VRRHDLQVDPLPDAAFELVHTRHLLLHLPSPPDALRRLLAAVCPGGWIAVGDVDFTTIELSRSTAAWKRTRSAFWDAALATGWDIRYGARLLPDLQALELAHTQGEYVIRHERGGLALGAPLLPHPRAATGAHALAWRHRERHQRHPKAPQRQQRGLPNTQHQHRQGPPTPLSPVRRQHPHRQPAPSQSPTFLSREHLTTRDATSRGCARISGLGPASRHHRRARGTPSQTAPGRRSPMRC
jgi:methyltransferase family protein